MGKIKPINRSRSQAKWYLHLARKRRKDKRIVICTSNKQTVTEKTVTNNEDTAVPTIVEMEEDRLSVHASDNKF